MRNKVEITGINTRLDEIQAADIAVVNQEVVFAGNHLGILGYPQFNVMTEQGDALVKAGFDVVLHATNHTMDQGAAGVHNTLEFWKKHFLWQLCLTIGAKLYEIYVRRK